MNAVNDGVKKSKPFHHKLGVKIGQRLMSRRISKMSNTIRLLISYYMFRNITLPYFLIKDHLDDFFIDYFDVRYWFDKDWVTSKSVFERRLSEAGGGLIAPLLQMPHVMLAGGAVVTLLTADDTPWRTYPFDFDLFLLASPTVLEDIQRILNFFSDYARRKGTTAHFIVRGMLIEVLIANERHVQIIITKYKTPEHCSYMFDLSYDQIYYDGNVIRMSYLAVKAFTTLRTSSTRVPVKVTRLQKLRTKGFTLIGSYQETHLNKEYDAMLQCIDQVKHTLDTFPDRIIANVTCPHLDVHTCSETVYDTMVSQIEYRWHAMRWLQHNKHFIFIDLDIFDHHFRVFSFNDDDKAFQSLKLMSSGNEMQVVGEHLPELGFTTLTFVHGPLEVLGVNDGELVLRKDPCLQRFVSKLCHKFELSVWSCPEIRFRLDRFGTRFYDQAERVLNGGVLNGGVLNGGVLNGDVCVLNGCVDHVRFCSLSFVVLVHACKELQFECLDVFFEFFDEPQRKDEPTSSVTGCCPCPTRSGHVVELDALE